MIAAKTTVPVLGVPVASRHLQGVDSLHSIVQMPKGVPVATFAIGTACAANAALFAVAMLATTDDWADIIHPEDRRMQRQVTRDALLAGREDAGPDRVILFGDKEGRIARANRGKDPLFFFAALQRQLGYPTIPRPAPIIPGAETPAMMARRIERLDFRVKLLEEEGRGGIDLSRFDPKNAARPFDE
jgi:hypothetical protein